MWFNLILFWIIPHIKRASWFAVSRLISWDSVVLYCMGWTREICDSELMLFSTIPQQLIHYHHAQFLCIPLFLFQGLTEANQTCSERYFCRRNATSATPNQGDNANICPLGSYCPVGTGEPKLCPKGTFNNLTGIIFFSL